MPQTSIAAKAQDSVDELAAKDVKTTDSDIRYMAYGSRIQTALRATQRYIAYVRSQLAFINSLHSTICSPSVRQVTLGRLFDQSYLPFSSPLHMAFLGYTYLGNVRLSAPEKCSKLT